MEKLKERKFCCYIACNANTLPKLALPCIPNITLWAKRAGICNLLVSNKKTSHQR